MSSALVVGSGPNGLAAAITLGQAGVEVTVVEAADTFGGGLRTSEQTVPGLLHDHCAAVVPSGPLDAGRCQIKGLNKRRSHRRGPLLIWPIRSMTDRPGCFGGLQR
jgi:monoamine oxidase